MKKIKKPDNYWFNPNEVFSHNAHLNFVVGARGCGKTYGCKKWAIKRFLRTGEQFIYLRRYKNEIKGIKTFFNKMLRDPDLKGVKMEVKGHEFFINDQRAGKCDLLTQTIARKSLEEPDVSTIIFDEFIIEKGLILYLPDEPNALISYMSSVFRERQDVRCICLANAIKWNNPYFAKYKFKPMENGYQKVNNNDVLLCVYQNELYDENNKKSWLANVSGESEYAESAFSNKFADVNDNFICKRSQDSFLMFNIKWKDGIYGVWASHDDTRYVVSYAYNPDIKTMCYTASDMSPNLLLLNKSEHPLNKLLKRAFSNGYLYYEDLYIRDVIYDIVTKMGVRR